ncbi:MAG: tRNA pseudouridine(13) synthase TruD [archaeon]
MYKIKQQPEDFIVNEMIDLDISPGPYLYCEIEKRNWNTMSLAKKLAKELRIKEKEVGFAGSKDKKAVTTQFFSFLKVSKDMISKLQIPDVKIKVLGYGKERLSLGDLKANKFIITIRNLDKVFKGVVTEMKNYFGEQRFGVEGKNHIIGKLLLQNKFKEACEELNLDIKNNDYIGALRKFSKKELLLYLHAYQSWLWNIKARDIPSGKLELVGFLTETNVYDDLLAEDGLTRRSFILRPMPELAVEGAERKVIVEVKDFQVVETSDDEIFFGKNKQVLKFTLPKGCYATMLLKQLYG